MRRGPGAVTLTRRDSGEEGPHTKMSRVAEGTTPSGTSPFGLTRWSRGVLCGAGLALFGLAAFAIARMALGLAPPTPSARELPLVVHLATIVPAIPLGAYLIWARKGGPRHKALGKLWISLMAVSAVSTLFLRQINEGGFSFVHLFSVLTLVVAPLAVLAARRGDVAAHRSHVTGLFVGALLVAGFFTFVPGRTMWVWAFG